MAKRGYNGGSIQLVGNGQLLFLYGDRAELCPMSEFGSTLELFLDAVEEKNIWYDWWEHTPDMRSN